MILLKCLFFIFIVPLNICIFPVRYLNLFSPKALFISTKSFAILLKSLFQVSLGAEVIFISPFTRMFTCNEVTTPSMGKM